MEEYRICEKCSHKNKINASFCAECGDNIEHIMITDKESPGCNIDNTEQNKKLSQKSVKDPVKVKICDICKTKNKVRASTCKKCDNNLFYAKAVVIRENTQIKSQQKLETKSQSLSASDKLNSSNTQEVSSRNTTVMPRLAFIGLHDKFKISIPATGGILGREGIGAKYLNKSDYVSRQHISLSYLDAAWVMTVLGSNPTMVNGDAIEKGIQYSLSDGDLVCMADMEFKVKLG